MLKTKCSLYMKMDFIKARRTIYSITNQYMWSVIGECINEPCHSNGLILKHNSSIEYTESKLEAKS